MNPRDRTLLEIFSAEQAEHVDRLRTLAEALAHAAPEAARPAFEEALRRAHTLKGAARAAGLEKTEMLAHRMEALLGRARASGGALDPESANALRRGLDAMEDVLAAVLANRPEPDIFAIRQALDALPQQTVEGAPAAPAPEAAGVAGRGAEPSDVELVRVSSESIDELIRSSSELLAAASAETAGESPALAHPGRIREFLEEWVRLRRDCASYVRRNRAEAEFAPVLECLDFIDGRLRELSAEARAAAAARESRARELRRRARDVHRGALRVRMTPAESVFGAFGSMVRDIAREERKEVEFRAEGLEIQADRVVLQALKDPVMHLLRNAVSHGIEQAREREAAGKPPAGSVWLRIDSLGDRLTVTVDDDGRGIDFEAVAAEGIRRGMIAASAAAAREELTRLIFAPGFSTSRSITSLAGRGIGLSVVQEAAARLHGEVAARPRAGGGASFVISTPLSVSTQHVVLMSAAGHVFGLPAGAIERLLRVGAPDIRNAGGRETVVADGLPVPLARLSDLLELPAAPRANHVDSAEQTIAVAVLAAGEGRAGIVVDRLLDDREEVVADLGLPPSMTGFTAGGIPLEDGSVAVMLDVNALFGRFRAAGASPVRVELSDRSQKRASRILVVDDSITTRSLEKSILEAHGYDVRVAVDGVEALERLRAEPAELVITDVLMPRMDGLQLLREMKNDASMARIPVIIVTSLDRREDQEKGLSLGADAYIVKRKFDQRELLDTVRQIL